MRIRQVYRDAFAQVPGGIERHVHDLALSLAPAADVEVVVGARRWRGRTWHEGPVAVRAAAELGRLGGIPLAPGLALRTALPGADVVHVHGPNPTAEVALPFAAPVRVVTWHCDPYSLRRLQPAYAAVVATVLGTCSRVLAASPQIVERSTVLRRLVDHHPDSLRIVPFGIDVRAFSPGAGASAERSSPMVLFVGGLRRYKGLTVLVRAMQSVDATLVVVGDGTERAAVEVLGRELLGDRIRLVGTAGDAELVEHYRAADVVCLPSTTAAEAFGLVLLEAMACGTPVISTEVGTATSVVNRDGETGLVVPPGDPAALASALRAILGDARLAAAMGRAGRATVCRDHDVTVMGRRILEIYREALEERADQRSSSAAR